MKKATDAFVLSCFAEDVRMIRNLGETILAGQQLVQLAIRYMDRLMAAGHTQEEAMRLLNEVIEQVRNSKEQQ